MYIYGGVVGDNFGSREGDFHLFINPVNRHYTFV